MYVAVLPRARASESGGSVDAALRSSAGPSTAPAPTPDRRRADVPRRAAPTFPRAPPREAADAALKAKREAGLPAILLDFADRMGEMRGGKDPGGDAGGGGGGGGGGGR